MRNNSVEKELIILTDFDLEHSSGAGFNRVICYAHAVAKENIQVTIFSSRYQISDQVNKNIIDKNVDFISSKKKKKYKTTFEDFHFLKLFSHYRKVWQLSQTINPKHNKAYLLYHSNLASVANCLLYLKVFKRCKIFIEKNELKTAIILNMPIASNSIIKKIELFLTKTFLLIPAFITDVLAIYFTGIIVISEKFMKLYFRFNKNLLKVPVLVNPKNRLEKEIKNPIKKNNLFTIGYFGTISEKKDGLFSLVEAVQSLSGYNVRLLIYGRGNKFDTQLLQNISEKNTSIKYCGHVDSKLLSEKIADCDLLAFPRPKNLQTSFGFSTKLGEFLISKKPVLTSSVSDNTYYLEDQQNIYMLKAEKKISIKLLIQKIKMILETDPAELERIGAEGHKKAIEYFNPLKYSNKLIAFLFP